MISFNQRILNRIVEKMNQRRISVRRLAELTNTAASTLNDKLKGRTLLNTNDIERITSQLDIEVCVKDKTANGTQADDDGSSPS